MAKKDWKIFYLTDNKEEYDNFLFSLPKYKILSTNKTKDCIASTNCSNHKMVLRYIKCIANECGTCKVNYRSIFCPRTGKWYFYQESNTLHPYDAFNDSNYSNDKWQKLGMPDNVKEIIDKLLFDKDIGKQNIYLDFSMSNLKFIYQNVFKEFYSTKEINFYKNNLIYLPKYLFQDLINLENLRLSQNKLEIVENQTFIGLKNLKQLFLDANFIRKIESNGFIDLISLN